MTVSISDISAIMEEIAPARLAEDWDNVGLQIGQKDWPVQKILVALDPLPEVVRLACRENTDLLITHHPLIFKALKSIDFSTPSGKIIQMAATQRMGIFAAHSNLDSVRNGINDILAERIGLKQLRVLGKDLPEDLLKLAVFVPAEYEHQFLNALFETPAGQIGSYSCCSFRYPGTGTYRPGTDSRPFSGKSGQISHTDEIRIEAVLRPEDVKKTVAHLCKNHPYEIMAYDLFPLRPQESGEGIGRIGCLEKECGLREFAQQLKNIFRLPFVKYSGRADLNIKKAALCSGSGSGLLPAFFSSDAQVYISGDLRYHDARDAEAADRGLIDIGHFASEHLIAQVLADRLEKILAERNMPVQVRACSAENDPYQYL